MIDRRQSFLEQIFTAMKLSSSQIQGLIAINIAAVIFGSAALYGKMNVSPWWIVALRAAFAAFILLIIGRIRSEIPKPEKKLMLSLSISGFLLAVHWLTFFLSVQMAGIPVATLTFAAFPMFTVISEALIRRRMIGFTEFAASSAIIFAVSLLINVHNPPQSLILGTIAGLAAAITFAWFGIASKKMGARLPALAISFYQNLTVAILLLPFLPFSHPVPDEAAEWLFLFLLGTLTTALMHQLYFYALRRLPAATCSGFVALEPVYAIIFAALLFAEPVTSVIIISGVLIISASFLLLRHETRNATDF
jgi:drug/metabolite transporter (DMT)-like permease